jgi:hypothetical protein
VMSPEPRETTVLLLPTLDATPDSAHMQAARQFAVRREMEYAFLTRQFKVMGESMAVASAGRSPEMNISHPSDRTPENLDRLAGRAGASWVVNFIILDVKMDSSPEGISSGAFTVNTHILLQVRDCAHHRWAANGDYVQRTKGTGSPIFIFKESLEAATNESLSAFLKDFPQVVPVSRDGSISDYLAGQSRPFIGDRSVEFKGIQSR